LSTRIVLIDGHQLTRLMIRRGVGCRIEETLYIKRVDEEFFE
jgi:restriction system protein